MKKHRQVILGSVVGILFSVLFILWGLFTSNPLANLEPANSVLFTLRWDFFLGFWVLVLIMTVSLQRFGTTQYLDGTPPPEDHPIEINRRVLRNTFEQAFVAIIGHIVLSTALPNTMLGIIPLLVILFSIGRLNFWVGYHLVDDYPFIKAFGHSMTYFPTVGVYVYLLYRISKAGLA